MDARFHQAKEFIEKAKKIVITGHKDPDADSLGAMLALKIALENLGKNSIAASCSTLSPNLKFLPQTDKISKNDDFDEVELVIGVDYSDEKRLDLAKMDLREIQVLTFDHHLIGKHLGFEIVESGYSSTCELVYLFLKYLNTPISAEIATCLLAGIISDTGGFQHPNISAQTFQIAAQLMASGAILPKISRELRKSNLPNEAKIWNITLEKMNFIPEIGLIYSFIDNASLSTISGDLNKGSLAVILSTAPEAKLSLLMAEVSPGIIEASLRSQKDRGINVAQIAQIFGGGGHILAAGFTASEPPAEILRKIEIFLDKPEKNKV